MKNVQEPLDGLLRQGFPSTSLNRCKDGYIFLQPGFEQRCQYRRPFSRLYLCSITVFCLILFSPAVNLIADLKLMLPAVSPSFRAIYTETKLPYHSFESLLHFSGHP